MIYRECNKNEKSTDRLMAWRDQRLFSFSLPKWLIALPIGYPEKGPKRPQMSKTGWKSIKPRTQFFFKSRKFIKNLRWLYSLLSCVGAPMFSQLKCELKGETFRTFVFPRFVQITHTFAHILGGPCDEVEEREKLFRSYHMSHMIDQKIQNFWLKKSFSNSDFPIGIYF